MRSKHHPCPSAFFQKGCTSNKSDLLDLSAAVVSFFSNAVPNPLPHSVAQRYRTQQSFDPRS